MKFCLPLGPLLRPRAKPGVAVPVRRQHGAVPKKDPSPWVYDMLCQKFPRHRLHGLEQKEGLEKVHSLVDFVESRKFVNPSFETPYGYHASKRLTGLCATVDVFNDPEKEQVYLSVGGAQRRVLGKGGFKRATLGIDYSHERACALLKSVYGFDDLDNQELLYEGKVTSELTKGWGLGSMNAGIYHSIKHHGARGRFYMPLAVHGDLGKRIHPSKPIATTECVDMMLTLCQQLKSIHGQGFAHRDIKVENVFGFKSEEPGSDKPRWALMDFGLTSNAPLYRTLEGTLDCMDPTLVEIHGQKGEMGRHRLEDQQRADIYSLGLVFYHLLTATPYPLKEMVYESIIMRKYGSDPFKAEQLNYIYDQEKAGHAHWESRDPVRFELLRIGNDLLTPHARDRATLEAAIQQLISLR